jgi:hypothetical protein
MSPHNISLQQIYQTSKHHVQNVHQPVNQIETENFLQDIMERKIHF